MVYDWKEGSPNPITTGRGSTAKVRHAVLLMAKTALCGATAKHGWQRSSEEMPKCSRCEKKITSTLEAK